MHPLPSALLTIAAAAGGVSGPTSTQWRLLFPSGTTMNNPNSTAVNISEVQMRATSGGSNQCSGGTASASSEYSGSFVAANGFDGNNSTAWASTNAGNNGSWLQYTFASAVAVNEFTVRATSGFGPTSIRLQYYDGAAWQTYIEVAGPLSWGTGETKTFTYSAPFSETGYTQWRMYIVTAASGSETDILEMEMRASVGGADRCFGGTASASSFFNAARAPVQAFDDVNSGFPWVPLNYSAAAGEWLAYQFWRKEQIAEVTIRNVSVANQSPQQFKIQYYNGSTWVDAYTSASGLSWAANETKTFTF